MAGALNVRLSGPRSYHGVETAEPWLNCAARDPGPRDLLAGLRLYRRAIVLLGLALAAALLT